MTVWRGIATLLVGSSSAKAITFASTLVLARVYSPSDFALLAVFSSVLVLATPLLTLKYSQSISLARSDGTARVLLQVSLVIAVIVSIATAGFALAMARAGLLPRWLSDSWLAYALAPALAMLGITECAVAWLLRFRDYRGIARLTLLQAAVGAAAKIGLGVLGFATYGLIFGHLAHVTSGALMSAIRLLPGISGRRLRKKKLWAAMCLMRDQPIYRLPAQLVLAVSSQAIILYFAAYRTPAETGQLSMALAVVGVPVGLLSQTSGQAFYAEAARLGSRNADQILTVARALLLRLGFLGIIPLLTLLLGGREIFVTVLGEKWATAGTFGALLAPSLFFQFLSAPLVGVYGVLGKQALLLKTNITRLLLVAGVLSLGILIDLASSNLVAVYSAAVSAHYISFTLRTYFLIKKAADA